jgi:serine/threonine protein kinase
MSATPPGPRSGVLPEGTIVASRYRVESVIGEGAQSIVYLARRVDDATPVALKVIHRHLTGNPKLARRFHREVEILKALEGEHVVRMLDFVEDDGMLAMALEYVEGTSLEAMIEEKAPLDLDLAIEIVLQVCAALGAAHANGIVHRDLKPANVLLARPAGAAPSHALIDGGSAPKPPASVVPASVREVRVKVVDFGFAKVLLSGPASPSLTEQGMIFGTPEYMAPEQARGETVDARADLYAAGVILYEMAVGEVPFKGNNALGTMTAHLVQPVPSPRAGRAGSRISATLEAVIVRALAKTPAERHASARELAEAIASARDEHRVIAVRPVADPDEIAQSDTDLHLETGALGHANTLRADEIAAMTSRKSEEALSVPPRSIEAPSTKPSAVRAPSRRPPAQKPAILHPEILDEPTAVSGEDPRAWSRLAWVLVAVVAAVVGVVIGVIVGTR